MLDRSQILDKSHMLDKSYMLDKSHTYYIRALLQQKVNMFLPSQSPPVYGGIKGGLSLPINKEPAQALFGILLIEYANRREDGRN